MKFRINSCIKVIFLMQLLQLLNMNLEGIHSHAECLLDRGYYMAKRRYGIYLRVLCGYIHRSCPEL